MSEKRQVLKAAGIVGFFTLVSRFTGLARDIITAAVFGTNRIQDIFLIAFELPNTLRRVMGEGTLSSFIVPLLTERRLREGRDAEWLFFNRAFNLLALISALITVAGMIWSRECFMLFGGLGLKLGEGRVSGAVLEASIDIGARMTRIMFPYAILLTLVAMMMGACNAHRKFGSAAFGSVVLNLVVILWGLFALRYGYNTDQHVLVITLCWAVLAGAVLRVLLMVPTLWAEGWRWSPSLTLRDRELMRLMSMMGLALLTMFISQINIIVTNQFAMYLGTGIKSALSYSQKLIQFPMALTATAVATGMLPLLTSYLLEGKTRELRDLMGFTKRLEMVLINPAMVGLVLMGLPILQLIFEHGRWTHADSQKAYIALAFYAPSLLPQGWMRILIPLFYARKDLVSPLKAAFVGMIANVLLNWYFALHTSMAQGGLALANTLATFVNYGALAWYLRGDLHATEAGDNQRIGETFWKSMLAALLTCGTGWLLYYGFIAKFGMPARSLNRALLLLPIMALVAVLYFITVRLLHVPDSKRASDMLLKKLRLRR